MSNEYTYVPQSVGFAIVRGETECFWSATEGDAQQTCDELNALHARVQELEAENARLRERIQRVTEETARIVNDMYEKEQNDPATEIEARLFVYGMLSYADYTGDDSDANN